MASIIAKSSDGKIWKNSDGKILKAKTFSQEVIQNGLAFWGSADPNFLTIVDGLVSEAYDIRGTGVKMIQNTVIYRFGHSINKLTSNSANPKLSLSNQIVKSMFIVVKCSISSDSWGLGHTYHRGIELYPSNIRYTNYSGTSGYYSINGVKKIAASSSTSINVIHSIDSYDGSLNTMNLGSYGNAYMTAEIYEWGWYNRVLSEMEVIYNINALNKKYAIF